MSDDALAIVGMAGRFPGASDVQEFWANLLSDSDQITRGPADAIGRVHGHGVVPEADGFDAAFFGFSPREATILDPQHRVFLECAWSALENAGYDPFAYTGAIGVYGGCGFTDHPTALQTHRHRFPGATSWELRNGYGSDFLTGRVAYKLGLRGPAVSVQTACSTSLVAVHLAGQALLAGDCDIALAGGVTIHVPEPQAADGDEDVLSVDGRCRSFDANANGTVAGDAAGIVVLRRLEDALADGDRVLAVVRGSAVNNDGSGKVGFFAPSVTGQTEAIRTAHLIAGVDPRTIEYVEAHGTGTEVGDPIEVRALAKAFGTTEKGFCRLSSVKASVGHTDAAAGVTGLITVVLALQHGVIPGTQHFRQPHPDLMLDDTPFTISAEPLAWPERDTPRRAAVNSLGLGGTNAHVIVEEAPRQAGSTPDHRPQLFPLSARSPAALAAATQRLQDALPNTQLADVAWTLQTGRRAFAERTAIVGTDEPITGRAEDGRGVAFLFPGQGGQYVGMGADLYRDEPVFRRAIDSAADWASDDLGLDLRAVLYPKAEAWAQEQLNTMRVCQPVLFAVQHALSELWQARGVVPAAVLGHSLGAYAAATTAGVLAPEDAMRLVLTRGRLLDELPAGSMLAVPLEPAAVEPFLTGQLALAAVNSPDQCVVTGPADEVEQLQKLLQADDVDVRPLRIAAAAHSTFVDAVLPQYAAVVESVPRKPPTIPWISDRTGLLTTAADVQEVGSWTAHLRHTVRFADALSTLFAQGSQALLELGPGHTLSTLARRHPDCDPGRPIAQSLAAAGVPDRDGGALSMLCGAGRLWVSGVRIDWSALHTDRARRRVELPTYPFQRTRFRLDEEFQPVEAEPAAAPATPLTATEQLLANAFADALGLRTVSTADNFFDLGGDSLIASRILAAVRGQLGGELTPKSFFQAPTVGQLAALADAPRAAVVPVAGKQWLLRRRKRPTAPLRLYCFAHSGGSPGEFLAWSDRLTDVELWAVQLPGRGSRMTETPYTSMDELVTDFVAAVDFEPPFVFFGHSLGALIAYEVARRLRDSGRAGPEALVLSAARAPHVDRLSDGVHELENAELVAAIEARYGRLPGDLRANSEMLDLMLPVLRADLALIANYRAPDAAPLACPVTAFGGLDDTEATEALDEWQAYTTGPFETQIYAGDHFYFREQTDDFLRHLAERLGRAVRRTGAHGPADALP
ncbi:acyltransferase domain-containing protein [Kribbella sandramycini]|uniref:Acyl transferase domain-containing protein/pimeloyl-ACP methyl ester carboxylesterase n=1 Tax=Kribbella sandramycini TaxID=60450 RepID=A0A7Y4L1T5_9ACTN|nr:type I polyketide synthase [Kribbella sandramycini]MBB6566602.1 acyl transferase domain-containing protein/pimeloyl-ACP methyl ester carboxylesterase [Kribbella sandramycini]NOL42743.1 acyltransferase domain-containing protein [Kribbella sandramycini]